MVLITWVIILSVQCTMLTILADGASGIQKLGFISVALPFVLLVQELFSLATKVGTKAAFKAFAHGVKPNFGRNNFALIPIKTIPVLLIVASIFCLRQLVWTANNLPTVAAIISMYVGLSYALSIIMLIFSEDAVARNNWRFVSNIGGWTFRIAIASILPFCLVEIAVNQ
jgi:hypothetical protein